MSVEARSVVKMSGVKMSGVKMSGVEMSGGATRGQTTRGRTKKGGAKEPATGCGPELLRELNQSLHAMSQPLTALLFMLEYGASPGGRDGEAGTIFAGGLEQCGRLIDRVRAMQTQVLRAGERNGAAQPMHRRPRNVERRQDAV